MRHGKYVTNILYVLGKTPAYYWRTNKSSQLSVEVCLGIGVIANKLLKVMDFDKDCSL